MRFKHEEIGLVDVEIGPSEGEAVGMALHDTGQSGIARTDDVQPGRAQVNDMARAEPPDGEMGIVGEYGAPCRRPRWGNRPSIASLRGKVDAPSLACQRFVDFGHQRRFDGGGTVHIAQGA